MIIPMTHYSFVLLHSDREGFLAKLQELGLVDITRSNKPVDAASSGMLDDIAAIESQIKCIRSGKNDTTSELEMRISALRKELDAAAPWGDYDKSKLAPFGLHYFSCQAKNYSPSWEQECAIQKVAEDGKTVWFVVLGDCSTLPLRELPAPERIASEVRDELKSCTDALEAEKKSLEDKMAEIPALEAEIHKLEADLSLYLASVSAEKAAEGNILVYDGFAPTENDATLKEAFDEMDIYYVAEPAKTEDNPPIKLRNNGFVKEFEPLTSMYGKPIYDEFDPTPFLSIFFLLFFAICMGDAGYGIILIIAAFFMKGKQGGLAKMWKLIAFLGAATTIVGFFLGTGFGVDLSTQKWIPEGLRRCMVVGDLEVGGSSYAKQMVLALIIGVIHLCIALATKTYWSIRRSGYKNSVSTCGWTLLIIGAVVLATVGILGFLPQAVFKALVYAVVAVSALQIYIFNKPGRNVLINFGAGLYDTYNMASGLMGDVLSYIRLYALGLSGAMLGQTFNMLANMVKGENPTWQWLPFVVILLFGHVLNIAMSALSAFVHPLRLNFVEFFKNSGYEGRGVSYNPVKK